MPFGGSLKVQEVAGARKNTPRPRLLHSRHDDGIDDVNYAVGCLDVRRYDIGVVNHDAAFGHDCHFTTLRCCSLHAVGQVR